jgi:hypothetical protein
MGFMGRLTSGKARIFFICPDYIGNKLFFLLLANMYVDLQRKLKEVSGHLQRWDRMTFGNVRQELRKLTAEQERLQLNPLRVGPSHADLKIKERIVELNHREEILWLQRSRIMWLAEGDKNTLFFHLRASCQKRRNKISKLKKADGDFTVNEQEMKEVTRDLYGNSEGVHNMEAVLGTSEGHI